MKSSSKSPRSSPLLQFFTSKDKPNNNTANNSSTPITPSPSNNIETQSTSSSISIIRTLSKCFDGGVGHTTEDSAILNEDELEIVNKAKSINVNIAKKENNKNGTSISVYANLCVNCVFRPSIYWLGYLGLRRFAMDESLFLRR